MLVCSSARTRLLARSSTRPIVRSSALASTEVAEHPALTAAAAHSARPRPVVTPISCFQCFPKSTALQCPCFALPRVCKAATWAEGSRFFQSTFDVFLAAVQRGRRLQNAS